MTGKTTRITVQAAIRTAANELKPKRITCVEDKNIGEFEAEILLAHVLKQDRPWLFSHPEALLRAPKYRQFHKLVSRRKKHEPIAYLVGEKEFYGLPFRVNRHTLIPRPESELLVDLARKSLFVEPSLGDLVWDVGTGSGAIATSIAHHITPRQVLATDISIETLRVARANARRLTQTNIHFLKADLLAPSIRHFLHKKHPIRLIIVANLPYLPTSDKRKLASDVVCFEPSGALFVGSDGTELIEKLLRQLAAFDIHFASAFFEFDPPQATKLKKLASLLFPHAEIVIHRDLAQRNRVLEISQLH